MMKNFLTINHRKIGPGQRTYIVAEMSGNHNQDFSQAISIIRAAKEAGADAIKLQTYTPDTITLDCDNEYFTIGRGTLWDGRKLHDLYGEAHTPWEWQPDLKRVADELGLDFFSTPFDISAVDFLESMGVVAYKVASFELVDISLIERIARTGKPIMMSTGMASWEEIDEAVKAAHHGGNTQLAVLKCTSAYPAPPEEMNLLTIPHLAMSLDVPVGLSDHTLGITAAIAAVALGACIVEKHFTLSRSVPGPDSAFSLEPNEFKAMVDAVRVTERALGHVSYEPTCHEAASRVFRRSLFVVRDMKAGDIFTTETVRSIRPGNGLHPRHLQEVFERTAAQDIKKGTPLSWDLIS